MEGFEDLLSFSLGLLILIHQAHFGFGLLDTPTGRFGR